MNVTIWCDGSCWPNPGGPAGWACVIERDGVKTELSGHLEAPTTNNRAELMAAIQALNSLGDSACLVDLYTDSQYLQKGAVFWINRWSMKNWQGVKNADLWQQISRLQFTHDIRWHWMPGHQNQGNGNDRADALAEQARQTK